MMSGYIPHPHGATVAPPRRYAVVAREGGWSVSLNGACTRPFADRGAAERIARQLQRQAEGLCHSHDTADSDGRSCGGRR